MDQALCGLGNLLLTSSQRGIKAPTLLSRKPLKILKVAWGFWLADGEKK
jgi:hypothetical protein